MISLALAGAAGREHERPAPEERRTARSRASSRTRPQTRSPSFSRRVIVHSMKTSMPGVHGLVLQRADQLEPGAVADVHEPPVGVTAERALRHLAGPACGRRRRPSARARARGRAPPSRAARPCASCSGTCRPNIVSWKCDRQLSSGATLPSAAAMPPSAITVCALPSSDLQTSAVRAPALGRRRSPRAGRRRRRRSPARRSRGARRPRHQKIRGSWKTPAAARRM